MEVWLRTLLLLTVTGSVLALILLALKPLVKNRLSFTWQYYIWLLVLARLCLPWFPAIEGMPALLPAPTAISLPAESSPAPPAAVGEAIAPPLSLNVGSGDGSAVTTAPTPAPAPAPVNNGVTVPWGSLLFALWLAGALVMAAKDLRGYALLARAIKRDRVAVNDDASLKLLRECRQALGIKREVALCSHPELPMPILMGVFKPRIILPAYEFDAEELRFVLLHELTHCRHRDNLLKWLVNAAVWLHWFNPLAHLVRAEMEKASELACDEAVSKDFSWLDKQDYAITLLSFMKRSADAPPLLIASMANDKRSLQNRISSLLREPRRSPFTATLTACLSVLLLFTALALGCVRSAQPEDSTAPLWDEEPQVMYASDFDSDPDSDPDPPTTIQDFANQWANAFYSRDAVNIRRLCADEELYLTIGGITNGHLWMGMSSPWPWFNDHVMEINADGSFNVYYYYRTSMPTIDVVKQTVHCAEVNGVLLATEVTARYFNPVSSRAAFDEAYRYGLPDDFARYAEVAERQVGEANQLVYEPFSDPISSARRQLNIADAEAMLEHTADSADATVTFTWPDGSATVKLTQYPSGVWVVQRDALPEGELNDSAAVYSLSREETMARGFLIIDGDVCDVDGNILIKMTDGLTPDGSPLDPAFTVSYPKDIQEPAASL